MKLQSYFRCSILLHFLFISSSLTKVKTKENFEDKIGKSVHLNNIPLLNFNINTNRITNYYPKLKLSKYTNKNRNQQPDTLKITINKNGDYLVNGENSSLQILKGELAKRSENEKNY